MPYLEEFNLCATFGWTFEECERTPRAVRQAFALILDAKDAAAQLAAEEAKRQASG